MNATSAAVLRLPLAVAPRPARPDAGDAGALPEQSRSEQRLGLGQPSAYGWALGPLLLLAYWSAGSATGFIDSRVLPAPWVAVSTAIDLIRDGRLQDNLLISATRAAEGLAFGVAAGVVVALFAGLTQVGGYVFDGLVQIKRAVPSLALIPFFILWFGIGEPMKVTVIAFGVFLPTYVHTHNALRGIDLRYVELAETLHVSYAEFLRSVVLPGALPGFLLGLRFAVMAAWLGLVVVEQFNATGGIGYMINLARSYAQSDIMLVGLVVYGMLGLSSDFAVRHLERRVLRWRRTLAQ